MKFKCPYDERPGKKFSDNCYAFGCIHQINGDPEIAYWFNGASKTRT